MCHLYIILSLLVISQKPSPLSSFQWKNRIIIVSGENSLINKQLDIYKKVSDELLDRDLIIFYSYNQKIHSYPDKKPLSFDWKDLKMYFNLPEKGFYSILIGKDGSIKQRNHSIISHEIYFDLIDSMPMRKREMKNARNH